MEQQPLRGYRFGSFEVDLRAGEVRKEGLKLRLQEQPFQVLAVLLGHAGDVVTREEMQKRLWSESTFVDFDHSLNIAINKIRETLGDSAEAPRFVETLPKHGYRFIASVAVMDGQPPRDLRVLADAKRASEEAIAPAAHSEPGVARFPRSTVKWRNALIWGLCSLVLLALAGTAMLYQKLKGDQPMVRLSMSVGPAEQLSGLG
jgi:DNA-binding winged helix-turn-helix (wHTH) protein